MNALYGLLEKEALKPTPHQQEALAELLAWWKLPKTHPDWKMCILAAPAGSGKTFLTKYFTQQLKDAYPLFTATTNEAARQLDLAGVKCAGTLHKILGLVPVTSCEIPYFIQQELPEEITNYNLLVVDEVSMAGYADPKDLEALPLVVNYAEEVGIRILWLGDAYQLPPVESKNGVSPIFMRDFKTITLSKVVRNSGDILEYCTRLRQEIDKKSRSFPIPRKSESVKVITPFALRASLTDSHILEQFRVGELRLIAWRNSSVDRYNEMIRIGLHGEEQAKKNKILPTDQILFIKPVVGGIFPRDPDKLVDCKDLKQIASVNTRAEVIFVKQSILYGIETQLVKFRVEGGVEIIGHVPTTSGALKLSKLEKAFKKSLESFSAREKAKQWKWWHAFTSCFVQLKHSYAITTHRSQGSNIEEVIVDAKDILSASWSQPLFAYKMAYTACSRAKRKLTLVMEK